MISADAFFSDSLHTVDIVISDFVSKTYEHFIGANTGLITLLFTLYVMLLGYRFINHDHHFHLGHMMRHLIVMLCVYGLVMNWHLYHLFVYNIFTNEPGNIAKVLVDAAGHLKAGTNIAEALDKIYAAVIRASTVFFGQLSFSSAGIAFFFYGVLVFLIGTLLCVFALLLFIYAKMMMAISLALGPIFILFVMWDATKGIFTAWLNKLITLALIPIVTSAVLVLMLSVINVTLPQINQPIDTMQFYGIAPFLGLTLATTLILSQVFRISSALGGGISIASLSQGLEIAKSTLNASGITPAARQVAQWSSQKVLKNHKRFFRNTP